MDAIGNIKWFLEQLHPLKDRTTYAELLLHSLVPTRENDSKGFAEDILLLLTAPNAPELYKPALNFQEDPKQLKQNKTTMMDILYQFTEPLTQDSTNRKDHHRLYKNDAFIDLDRDLYDADHFDLSRFLYLSFDTLHKNPNERENLKPFFFRSAMLSLFGQLIVNAMTYTKRGVLSHDQKCPFLHVVTGAPGIGKSAIRYPFITLLMGFGVKTITTKREGECAFVFRRTDKTKAGRAKVTVQDSHGDEGIRNFYHPKEGAAYDPGRLTDRKSVCLGQLIVPSVECFPHFLRLIVGKTDHVNQYRTRTGHDITVTAPSFLKWGSRITQNSVLKIRGHESVTCPHPTTHIREDMRIEKGSIIKAHSTLEDCSSLVYG
ncbi:hypothetical protein BLNAU_23772 [Blattamonas nauphoetae]|uniref:Uncharacterized protein n=1 Tax=Blattamonas nauphoetae TaxID=2049346 RepID=A0ABQ9WP99_9EUKA|nr:hypothetical protein BLNAU_23772 [Blattamonas nauphoetae]